MSELTLERESSTTDFVGGKWQTEINVRDFIQKNYTPYDGDSSFLAGPTEATTKLWQECCELFKKERENGGVLDMDTKIVSTIVSHGAGYIDKDLENRMASTIRHNRARGTHQIIDMSHIVITLTQNGWTEEEISKHLGMELDEIIRLKQITGLRDSFANHVFSKSWEEFERNL